MEWKWKAKGQAGLTENGQLKYVFDDDYGS